VDVGDTTFQPETRDYIRDRIFYFRDTVACSSMFPDSFANARRNAIADAIRSSDELEWNDGVSQNAKNIAEFIRSYVLSGSPIPTVAQVSDAEAAIQGPLKAAENRNTEARPREANQAAIIASVQAARQSAYNAQQIAQEAINCEVSDWSDAGECSIAPCGTQGQRRQTRTVIRNAENGGAACPALEQYALCDAYPCPTITEQEISQNLQQYFNIGIPDFSGMNFGGGAFF
jgi:hypothetical protein